MIALVIPGYFCKFHTIVFNNYATDDTMMQKHHYQDKERHENAINRQQEKFSEISLMCYVITKTNN